MEIAIDSVAGARAAVAGGASRLELCAHLDAGGLTPSAGLLAAVLRQVAGRVPVFAMVRPRGGDFCFDDDEFEVMQHEVTTLRDAGAQGIVTGLLLPTGLVDADRTRQLVERAAPLPVTFHRAFDLTTDAAEALETLVELGIARVLTSGQAATAEAGIECIETLCQRARDRIVVMPGAGIRAHNIRAIAERTGARELHLSARGTRPSTMQVTRDVAMGPADENRTVRITDETQVRDAVGALAAGR